jgi:uncharacterized protein (DUF427 family)
MSEHADRKPKTIKIPGARPSDATCRPHKDDRTYYSIPPGGGRSLNAVWTYEAPYAAVAAIRDHVAF